MYVCKNFYLQLYIKNKIKREEGWERKREGGGKGRKSGREGREETERKTRILDSSNKIDLNNSVKIIFIWRKEKKYIWKQIKKHI